MQKTTKSFIEDIDSYKIKLELIYIEPNDKLRDDLQPNVNSNRIYQFANSPKLR